MVGITSLTALAPHARAGHVRVGQGLLSGALGTAGSFAGSALASHVAPQILLTAFAALMLIVATVMLRRSLVLCAAVLIHRPGALPAAGRGPAALLPEPPSGPPLADRR